MHFTAQSVPELIAYAFSAVRVMPAAEFQGEVLTRAGLDERSDQLARWLVVHGASAGVLVGIYMDRSLEMLVGILGVMKAGAAYVPLDPAFPRGRTEQILAETKVRVLLTLERHREGLPQSGARTLCLDGFASEWEAAEPETSYPILPEVTAEMRAYVLFTSGSTGKPKGVEVTHGSVVNLLSSAVDLLGAGVKDRLVAITTLAFDISVLELLLPLVCGGTVVVASKQEAADTFRLMDLLRSARATMLQATPVTFRSLLELGFAPPAGFKMLCGGEAWAPAMAEKLLATGGQLWNMYGPTETTVWSSITEVERGAERVTIGPPIANTRFYVMDAEMKTVLPGGQGELWIGGAGVAKGYLGRAEMTIERFRADPYFAGDRMYGTGDEVRLLDGGRIEFVGRLDQQIKLRGFRIELGEIECALQAIDGVREAVVLLRNDASGEDFLVGYYVARKGVTAEELKAALRLSLPDYMVPKVLEVLESLPLTPNGKTDRRALAELELAGTGADLAIGVADKRGTSEEAVDFSGKMLSVWTKLFPGEPITEDSDFFELGGDSLLVVRLQSLISSEFDLRLTMADATQYFTLAAQTRWAKQMRAEGGRRAAGEMNPAVLPLQREGSGPPVFIIPQMLNFRILADELGRGQPVYGLQIMDDEVTPEMATATFEELASIYCGLIREAQPEGPYRLAGWCLWGWMAYEIARQLEAQGDDVEMLAIIDAWAPGYWTRYSPTRQFFVNASHFGQRIKWYVDSLRSLPPAARMKDGARRFREMGASILRGLPRGLRPEMPVVETLRIQQYASKAAESYRPGPIKGNVVLFKSELRPTGHFIGEDMGWGAILGREVRLDTLPGNHNDIFSLTAARIMAQRMHREFGLAGAEMRGKSL